MQKVAGIETASLHKSLLILTAPCQKQTHKLQAPHVQRSSKDKLHVGNSKGVLWASPLQEEIMSAGLGIISIQQLLGLRLPVLIPTWPSHGSTARVEPWQGMSAKRAQDVHTA